MDGRVNMSVKHGQIAIPERLVRTIRAWEGERGAAWLAALPERVADHLDRWDLTLDRVFEPGGQISLILYVHRADGTPAALKVGLVSPETAQEHTALGRWAGVGAVRLLEADPAEGTLLLERLHGDIPLRSLAEAKAMLEAAGVLQRLWVPPGDQHPFSSVQDRVAALCADLRRRSALPGAEEMLPLVDEALETAAELLADQSEQLLLHGDFHHGNVLAAERAHWLAIDPKPLVGERAYDLAWLAQDRMETLAGNPGSQAAARRRLQRLADSLDVDPARLRGWTFFRTVEAGLWSMEVGDRTGAELYLEFAGWL